MKFFKGGRLLGLLAVVLLALPCTGQPALAGEIDGTTAEKLERGYRKLAERERAIAAEQIKLDALRGDVNNKIEEYEKLLTRVEQALNKLSVASDDNLTHVVKTYEAMNPDAAAARLSRLDEPTAVKILMRMKSKKAGAVLAEISTKKAASLTLRITRIVKNFPSD